MNQRPFDFGPEFGSDITGTDKFIRKAFDLDRPTREETDQALEAFYQRLELEEGLPGTTAEELAREDIFLGRLAAGQDPLSLLPYVDPLRQDEFLDIHNAPEMTDDHVQGRLEELKKATGLTPEANPEQ